LGSTSISEGTSAEHSSSETSSNLDEGETSGESSMIEGENSESSESSSSEDSSSVESSEDLATSSTENNENSSENESVENPNGEQVADAAAWEKALTDAFGYDFIYDAYFSYVDNPSFFNRSQYIIANKTIWNHTITRDCDPQGGIFTADGEQCTVFKEETVYVYGKLIFWGKIEEFQDWADIRDIDTDFNFNEGSFEEAAEEVIGEIIKVEKEWAWYKSLFENMEFDEEKGIYIVENFSDMKMKVTILIKEGKVKKIERSYTTEGKDEPDRKGREYKESIVFGGASEVLEKEMPAFPSDLM
jgi:hypothetical protein